jgi:hypothetical protein
MGGLWKQRKLVANEKRGVPRPHGNMLPGNSFPQICVVSGKHHVEILKYAQEYLGDMTESNAFT